MPRAHRPDQPPAERVPQRPRRGGAGRGRRRSRGPPARGADRRQGRDRRHGHAHHGRLPHSRGERRRTRRRRRRASARGGGRRGRKAQHPRVRLRRDDHEPPLRPLAQSLVARAHLRGLERRQRRSSRGRSRRRHARHRHGRIDPHPRGPLWCHRPAAVDRSGAVRGCLPRLVDVRHRRPRGAECRGLRVAARCRRRHPNRRRGRRSRSARRRRRVVAGSRGTPGRGSGARGNRGALRAGVHGRDGGGADARGGRHDPAAPDASGGDERAPANGCARASRTTGPTSAPGCSPGCSCPRPRT